MILFLILLILAMVAVGLYAAQNTATHDVTLGNYHWSGVADWVPAVVAAGVVVLLFLVYMVYAGTRSRMRHGALRRRITTHEGTIADLRKENQRLREENARLKSQTQSLRTPQPAAQPAEAALAATPAGQPETPATSAEPDQPQASFGDRVRAFLNGRGPAED